MLRSDRGHICQLVLHTTDRAFRHCLLYIWISFGDRHLFCSFSRDLGDTLVSDEQRYFILAYFHLRLGRPFYQQAGCYEEFSSLTFYSSYLLTLTTPALLVVAWKFQSVALGALILPIKAFWWLFYTGGHRWCVQGGPRCVLFCQHLRRHEDTWHLIPFRFNNMACPFFHHQCSGGFSRLQWKLLPHVHRVGKVGASSLSRHRRLICRYQEFVPCNSTLLCCELFRGLVSVQVIMGALPRQRLYTLFALNEERLQREFDVILVDIVKICYLPPITLLHVLVPCNAIIHLPWADEWLTLRTV